MLQELARVRFLKVLNWSAKTKTSKGLKVFVNTLNQTFKTGRKVADDFKENMRIQFDDFLPQWNYVAVPF